MPGGLFHYSCLTTEEYSALTQLRTNNCAIQASLPKYLIKPISSRVHHFLSLPLFTQLFMTHATAVVTL